MDSQQHDFYTAIMTYPNVIYEIRELFMGYRMEKNPGFKNLYHFKIVKSIDFLLKLKFTKHLKTDINLDETLKEPLNMFKRVGETFDLVNEKVLFAIHEGNFESALFMIENLLPKYTPSSKYCKQQEGCIIS